MSVRSSNLKAVLCILSYTIFNCLTIFNRINGIHLVAGLFNDYNSEKPFLKKKKKNPYGTNHWEKILCDPSSLKSGQALFPL